MNRTIVRGGLGLVLLGAMAATGRAQAPQDPAAQPAAPNILEDTAYVRRFSAGITGGITPIPLIAATQTTEKPDGTPPLEIRSNVDPNTKVSGYGITIQTTLTERLAIAIQPSIRSFNAHTFIQKFEGTDNSSTSFDDRDKTDIDEIISGKHLDVPVLLRFFSKGHHDEGPRWFFEGGPVMRLTRSARAERKTFAPNQPGVNETVAIPTKNGLGVTVGIGGQFIDDFGIRAIPEFRYTRWVTKSFNTSEISTRASQLELLFTLSF